ncbi:helix-turn-helix domain-containing protein [Serratia quinivorans]|uniref:Helix-turn-helix domain-containing protein n=1 Tax=Serratia quinivorans TaxID=137545 RepID=A0ABV3UDA1_9GAMM|nr:helix-turn-helix domain-containing protein [Serratia quinivorans]CAI0774706.1 anaerobic benzoate catabolism transcriptional regulator [Serratia quinivorans]CAI0922547.1 anaerobic benzoate catabolism transcriptional regulator [Serratia quinivorans]CAI1826336.1 anaerobic benzoate catabolism transcriptional regulator [Serratia quinivorans]
MQTYRIRQLRLEKGWSQEQLATIAGLSTRTVQRIENGEQASLETLTAIASAMGLQIGDLYQPAQQDNSDNNNQAEQVIRRQVEAETKLLSMAVRFACIGLMLFVINWFTHPQYLWSLWAIGGMSIALVMRATRTLLLRDVFSRWQQQRLAEKLRRMP